ncbi:MAG: serine--tRNA ligase [Nitrospirae bacterium]|nr:serine--tRNA ligase [Nitrospirota bacterium]MBI3593935.1 serine--tRNA ligase [Nitrospirota bacterium]
MIDIKVLREQPDWVVERLRTRGFEFDLSQFHKLDHARREINLLLDQNRQKRNQFSEQFAKLMRDKAVSPEKVEAIRKESEDLKGKIALLEEQIREADYRIDQFLLNTPNFPHSSVPVGKNESENVEVKKWGAIPSFSFAPKEHWEIGEKLGILDFERGAKITGARFCVYRGNGALMERALINFMMDLHAGTHRYTEVLTPFIVNEKSMTGTGQLPKFEEDLFGLKDKGFYLIPTAEVPVTNIHQGEILEEKELPISYVAYSPCFRREAGSYGKDTKGLIRQHQFNKVELVKFCRPDDSYNELDRLLADAEAVLIKLNLPYRVVSLSTGDLGFSAAKTFDIEVWLPGQNRYREISSCSNFESFQARRADIKYRAGEKGRPVHLHTLNGSALAVGRTLVAILENFQQPDGSVTIPESLRPYMGGKEKIVGI